MMVVLMSVLLGLGVLCLASAGLLALRASRALKNNRLRLTLRLEDPSIAILIPARYESAVIAGLLQSIAKQTQPVAMEDVYVIVESETDPTVAICEQWGCQVILRRRLKWQRKGYALDEAVKQILKRWRYDLYFIFDADNRLSPNYLAEMLKIYHAGYQMATGYRSSKNGNQNVIAAVSSLTFSMINTLGNKARIRHQANIIFSGTGCYVAGELVERWKGWPFHSLTEDYEMSLYAILRGISTFYHEKAVFYDEQPTKYRQTVDQRVRWIKGYFTARRKYLPKFRKQSPRQTNYGSIVKESIGVKPVILALLGVICLVAGLVVSLLRWADMALLWWLLVALVLIVYVILMIITIVMIRREQFHFEPHILILAVLFNPIYLLSYVPCALKALLTKNVAWAPIQHGEKS